MKKKTLIKIILVLALIESAFFIGMKTGENLVIHEQDIWSDGEYMYIEYNGQIHYYD